MRSDYSPADCSGTPPTHKLPTRILPLDQIRSSALPRDRLDLTAEAGEGELLALKTSLSLRGQQSPVTVYRDEHDGYQLVSGWRRMIALQQLADEQGEGAPSITARLTDPEGRMDHYINMVESNLLHKPLSFAELAQFALNVTADPALQSMGVGEVMTQLYGTLPKMKRSYIRSFVSLLQILGKTVNFPKKISRNQGIAVCNRLKTSPETADDLRENLQACSNWQMQGAVFERYLMGFRECTAKPSRRERRLQLGKTHITGRPGECVIRSEVDYASIHTSVLSRAIRAFEQALRHG